MKLDKQRISALFAMFTDIPDLDLPKWSNLVDLAETQLLALLKPNVDISRNMERLCIAAAACAYCNYTLLTARGGASSEEIRVGDIAIKSSGDELDATSTRDFFMSEIADLISNPTGFAFVATGDDE